MIVYFVKYHVDLWLSDRELHIDTLYYALNDKIGHLYFAPPSKD